MKPEYFAKVLAENAESGNYIFHTDDEIISLFKKDERKEASKIFKNATYVQELYKLGWVLQPRFFSDINDNKVNYSKEALKELKKKGGTPHGYRISPVS